MIMPANYSVIAENEMSYVDGGFVPMMSLKTLETNLATIIGNTYLQGTVDALLGGLFQHDAKAQWKFGTVTDGWKALLWVGDDNKIDKSDEGDTSGFSRFMKYTANTIGVAGAIWTLGTYSAKSSVNQVLTIQNNGDGPFVAKK